MSTYTDQPDEDAEELYDVSVGDRVEPPEQCVEQSDASRHDDGGVVVHVDDHTHRRS